jgi:hypothetical protein
MSPESHDAAFAAVSHLPHLLAFALMNSVAGQPHGEDFLSLAGPGFRDFTRIAASDPQVWRDVLIANREELLAQSRHFQQALAQFEQLIAAGQADALEQLITQASHSRATWRVAPAPQPRRPTCPRPTLLIPCTTCPSRSACPARGARQRAPARLQEHLQPRAAAGRAERGHAPWSTTCWTPTTPGDAAALRQLGCGVTLAGTRAAIDGPGARGSTGRAVPGQCRHGHAPADGRAGGAGRRLQPDGVPRMHERPIGDLVDALRQLGCRSTTGPAGFPPLRRPPDAAARPAHPGARRCLQPVPDRAADGCRWLPPGGGRTIEVVGELISKPYIDITLELLARFGIGAARGLAALHHPAGSRYQSPGASMSRPTPRRPATSSRWAHCGRRGWHRRRGPGLDPGRHPLRRGRPAMGAAGQGGPNWLQVAAAPGRSRPSTWTATTSPTPP